MAFSAWEQFADDVMIHMATMFRTECPFDKVCEHHTKETGFVHVWQGNAQEQLGQFLKERFEFMQEQEVK